MEERIKELEKKLSDQRAIIDRMVALLENHSKSITIIRGFLKDLYNAKTY